MQKTQSLKNKRNLLFHKSREPCPTPALLTAGGFAHHARTLMLISVLPSVFLYEFSSKRGTARSLRQKAIAEILF